MKFLDKFKKKIGKTKPAESPFKKGAAKAVPTKTAEAQTAEAKRPAADRKVRSEYAHRVLLRPVISEKSANLHALNQYVFEVSVTANKIEVKKAIAELYGTAPEHVRMIAMSGKVITRGRTKGRTAAYKKAIVRMPKGVELPIYEGV